MINAVLSLFVTSKRYYEQFFENATVCGLQNLMDWQTERARTQSHPFAKRPLYTSVSARNGSSRTMGFGFDGEFPEAGDAYSDFEDDSFDHCIPLEGFVEVVKDPEAASHFYHPPEKMYDVSPGRVDFNCVNQLNVTIATKWKDGPGW